MLGWQQEGACMEMVDSRSSLDTNTRHRSSYRIAIGDISIVCQ